MFHNHLKNDYDDQFYAHCNKNKEQSIRLRKLF